MTPRFAQAILSILGNPVNPVYYMALFVAASAAMAQPQSFRDCADCPEMVAIPAGRFMMGVAPGEESSEGLDPGFHHRSEPQHEVHVRRFSAGKYEITRREYLAFALATGRASDGCSIWAGTDFIFDTTKDWRNPGYPQDAHKLGLDVSPIDGAEIMRLIERIGRMPPEQLARVEKLISESR